MLTAVQDFESELFFRVKRLVGYYLMPRYHELQQKVAKADKLMVRLLLLGERQQISFVLDQRDMRERELVLLERIQYATTFATLIPPLQWWMKLQQ